MKNRRIDMEIAVFLGTVKNNLAGFKGGEKLYLGKHKFNLLFRSWDFGKIVGAENNTYLRFSRLVNVRNTESNSDVSEVDDIFVDPQYSNCSWRVIRDIFVNAYALSTVSEMYRYGCSLMTTKEDRILQSNTMNAKIDKDLEKVLNHVWDILVDRRLKQ